MKHHVVPWLAGLAVALTACGPAAHDEDRAGHHAHTAPHGGTLVELGDHEFHLEFVFPAEGDRLAAYVLDGHAERFIRVPIESFEVDVTLPEGARTLTFEAVANDATGETVGNTSQFEARADWLDGTEGFDAVLKEITIQGRTYRDLRFRLGGVLNL
jgi:hypothetical protein